MLTPSPPTTTPGLHEEIERYERLAARDFHSEAKSHRERLHQNGRVRQFVDSVQDRSRELLKLYEDEDGSRKDEIASITGEDIYSTFYERLRDIKDYHRRHPGLEVPDAEGEEVAALAAEPPVEFSGEEGGGRFLDLHEFHRTFANARFGDPQLSYLAYLDTVADPTAIPRRRRATGQFRDYLTSMLGYLEGFLRKARPLACLSDPIGATRRDFEERWERGEVSGWEDQAGAPSEGAADQAGEGDPAPAPSVDLEAFDTSEELASGVDAAQIKQALQDLGLKSGGTEEQRAARLMATKGKPRSAWDPKLFAKGKGPLTGKPGKPGKQGNQAKADKDARRLQRLCKAVASLEAQVLAALDLLGSTMEDTKRNVEKKATSTYAELEAEKADEAAGEAMPDVGGIDDDDDDEGDIVFNPLHIPLGWDGKPIPYWLYKLHGLNHEFKCEICGNFSYWGRRAYERHFTEYRHQHGLRCLGIPNVPKVFNEVTRIDDALKLWKEMQQRERTTFDHDKDEEFEDSDGNVYNKKTYLDLQRQGLL